MTDGNTDAINKHLDEREDYDALQEVKAELEQAEARIEELETTLQQERSVKWKVLESPFKQRVQELEAKLAKALEALEYYSVEAFCLGADNSLVARTTLAELKGQGDE